MDIISVFKDTVDKYGMLQKGDKVLVGVSGGPDSVCLLHLLLRHREEFGISLAVAHLNHCFRGQESDEDETFVRDLAGQWGLPFYGEKVDVPAYIKKTGLSPEDAARRVRYAFFERVRRETGAGKVALAHNSNDREETVLMNIFRGTGLEGLVGIEAVRDHYIRPLIEVERDSIEDYLKREGIPYRIDSTNLQTFYYRNKLRLELIPLIKREYCPHLSAALKRLSEIASVDISLLGKLTDEAFARVVRAMPDGVMIDTKKFNELHEALKYRVVRKAVERILGDLRDFEYRHARMTVEFIAEKPTGSRLDLPGGLTGVKSYECFYIYRGDPPVAADFYYELPVPGKIDVPEAGVTITSRIVERDVYTSFKTSPLKAYLDYDKIKGNLAVRKRRPGDRFIPFGSRFSKKLQDFFVDNKVPAGERDRVPIVVAGDRILWVGGMRIDDRFKVTGDTKKILVLEIQRKNGGQEESTC
ncbi:tRNA lysidine(34) synthetase TilS [Thermosediminibacter oceani]|uniref:tRNA(Ile)-lysidine synthase n=1 Tax=Thermosediminibacter oceani (strain ATCC BAA-1034 / DSM 16646 / JW/IW-1228P) TaxID=555079 RepID=D9S0F4_THEOJ|nr:tRNA lysidine(34) synthetase TilS [Thermosediminibacter oceani]ADL08812.1 tRNA(Ile)-lysidine synthetase [Thermosediminibacter oceani DSM 16646]